MTVLLFAASHAPASDKDTAVEKELARMQGLWCRGLTLEFSHRDGGQGESRPLDELEKSHYIQGNKWIMFDFEGKITKVEKTITLDISSNPKKIQLTTTQKGRDGKPDVISTEYGIYQLNGDGMTVHYGLEDLKGGTKPAPKQFLQSGKLVEGVEGFATKYSRIDPQKPKLHFTQDGKDVVVSMFDEVPDAPHVLWTHATLVMDGDGFLLGPRRPSKLVRIDLSYHVIQSRDDPVLEHQRHRIKSVEVKWRLVDPTKTDVEYRVNKEFNPSAAELKELASKLSKLAEETERRKHNPEFCP
jgi:uncharacterized protein (TIGR03067 family)